MKSDKSIDFYKQISEDLENILKREYVRSDPKNLINFAAHLSLANKHQVFSFYSVSQLESTCKLVIDNYFKFIDIVCSPRISHAEKLDLISRFTTISFENIVQSLQFLKNEYFDKVRGIYESGTLLRDELDRVLRNYLKRLIELIFIIEKFYPFTEINNFLHVESQKIIEFGKSLNLPIRKREENLRYYLSVNHDSLLSIEKKDSVVCYLSKDSTFEIISFQKIEVENAQEELKRLESWKLFRSIKRKESELTRAKSNLEIILDQFNLQKMNARNRLQNEIDEMKNEIFNLEGFFKFDFAVLVKNEPSINDLNNLIKNKIRKKLNPHLKRVDGAFDYFNILQFQNLFVEVINSYKETFINNKSDLNLTISQIEVLFNDVSNELYKEYFE